MRLAARGRACLKGQWAGAVTVQLTMLAAGAFLLVLELLLLQLTGIGMAETVHVPDWLANAGLWPHAAIIAGVAMLDLLLVSPLRLGEAAYYYQLTQGQARAREATCAFRAVRDTGSLTVPQSATHEFVPVRPETPKVPVRTIWGFYRKGYGKAVGWRLVMWGWRTVYGLACFAPATLLWGYSEVLRVSGDASSLTDVTRLFCGLFGLFALAAGWVVQQLMMLRYLPAQFRLAEGASLREALRDSRRLMKGNTGDAAWMYMGFSGWLAACLFVIPIVYVSPLFLTTRAIFVRRLAPAVKKRPAALPAKAGPRPGRQPSV